MWLELGGWISWRAFQTSLPLSEPVPLIICSVNWYYFANPTNCTLNNKVFLQLSRCVHTHKWDCTSSVILNASVVPCCGMAAPLWMPTGTQDQPLQALWLTQICFSLQQCTVHGLTAGISHCWQLASPGLQVTMLSSDSRVGLQQDQLNGQ